MSTQPAPAPNMTETSVIKHYKKQLIYRQHDVPDPANPQFLLNEVSNTKIYDLVESERNCKNKEINVKKVRRKRKNKNCRGQFRHEAMELIKLGNNSSHPLCKKDPVNRTEKPSTPKEERCVPPPSVIQTNHATKPILDPPLKQLPPPPYAHTLPQMVPERRNSRELHLKPPDMYHSPPHRTPLLPEYRIPFPVPHAYPPFRAPPPYPVMRSPPRPVPRSPIRPIPQHGGYGGIHFPFTRGAEFNGKRKLEEEHPVVAAIDLTVDHKGRRHQHKCQCECGKTYPSVSKGQEVIISQVPSTYIRGRMVNGLLQLDDSKKAVSNGVNKSAPVVPKVTAPTPPLFLIDDLLGRKKQQQQQPEVVPIIRTEPNRVIVSTNNNHVEEARHKTKDYSVSTIIGSDNNNRRQSVDIDTISISSSGSESVRSPRPRSIGLEKQIPHGKLFYYKNNNSFIRYFEDTQKKLFLDSIMSSEGGYDKNLHEDKEVIELPRNTIFSSKDSLTVEEYVSEMTLVEKFIPRDFFLFYKFVTGYQICNNNLPVSFLTFLKVYNTNGLKILLERYISSLKQN